MKITDLHQSSAVITYVTKECQVVKAEMIRANFVEKRNGNEMCEKLFQGKGMPFIINTRRKKML